MYTLSHLIYYKVGPLIQGNAVSADQTLGGPWDSVVSWYTTARTETLYLECVCVSDRDGLSHRSCWGRARNSLLHTRTETLQRGLTTYYCLSKCPKSWFKQQSLTTIIISHGFHGSGIPQGSAGLFRVLQKQKQTLRQDFLSKQLAKGSRERSGRQGRRGSRKRRKPRQVVVSSVLQKAGSTWSTVHLWSVRSISELS